METDKLISLIIGGIAVTGGLAIGAVSVMVSVPWAMKEKIAKMEIKNRERMAMLEKGIDPEIIFRESRGVGQDPLLWGLLLAGMGLGVLLGYIVHLLTGWDRMVLTNGMAILFGGVGLIVFSFFRRQTEDRKAA